ncbi:MAG: biotin/lipoyl-binding protein [Bacillota bacterium]|nr:biotin/lipoyl-binding protein [Bacillota bacterium]
MKKKIIWAVIIIAAISSVIYLGLRGKKTSADLVKTKEAALGDIDSYLSTTGTVKSKINDEYFSQSLKIKKVNVKVGDKVKAGDVIASYDTSDLDFQVKTLNLQYDNAVLARNDLYNQNKQADDQDRKISDLKNQIAKTTDQVKIKDLTNQLETAAGDRAKMIKVSSEKLQQADNSVSLSKLSLDSAKDKLNKANEGIKVKNSGVVTELNIKDDSMPNSMSAAVVVQDLSKLYVQLQVSKYDTNSIKIGQSSTVKLRDKEYKGRVTEIDPAATTSVSASGQTTNLGVNVDILDNSPDLKVDFDVDVDILTGSAKNVLKIPGESIVTDKDGLSFVFIYENGKAVKKKVTLGVQSDAEAEVKEGLKEKDIVILNPTASIENGTAVTLENGDGK